MEEIILQLVGTQGIWAVLFVFLLLYTIRKNDNLDRQQDAREEKYQQLLAELTASLAVVNDIKVTVDGLNEKINGRPANGESGRIL